MNSEHVVHAGPGSSLLLELEWEGDPSKLMAAATAARRFGFHRVCIALAELSGRAPTFAETIAAGVNQLRSAGQETIVLSGAIGGPHYPIDRQRTRVRADIEQAIAIFDAARLARVPYVLLTVPAVGSSAYECRFLDEMHTHVLEVIQAVRFEAEMRAIYVAVSLGHGFLTSPVEARAFIDECNSPWVGAALSIVEIAAGSQPVDWVQSLGRRAFLATIRLSNMGRDDELLRHNVRRSMHALGSTTPIVIDAEWLQEQDLVERLRRLTE